MKRLLAALAAILALALCAPPAEAFDPVDPLVHFQPGETLSYELKWGPFTVGYAELSVQPTTEARGKDALHFRMTARTTDFADNFYKVRDEAHSYVNTDMTRSILFVQTQREGSYFRDIEVRFHPATLTADYSSREHDKLKQTIRILPGTFDPLSIFYYFRAYPKELSEGLVIHRAVADGKKCVEGEATVIRREVIEVGAKAYDTYLVQPDLKHLGGVFKKSEDAALNVWVTADERRIPVRVRSKVIVGHFTAELTDMELGRREELP